GRRGGEVIPGEGVYGDQWMGRETVLKLAGHTFESVEIEGQLSAIASILPQELMVQIAGQRAHVVSLTTAGPFSMHLPLSPDGARPGAWEVSLTPSRTVCPMEQGLSSHSRERRC